MLSLILSRPLTSALAALALLFAVLWGVQSFRAAHLKERVETAEARELGAKVQARLSERVLVIQEKLHETETIIRETAHVEAGKIAADPAGSAVLDRGFRDRWASAVKRVREAGSQPSDHGPGEPSGAVSEGQP